jgi:copper chaperone CopZ
MGKSKDVGNDHLALIKIEGMHCLRCEQAIQKTLKGFPGVHEVEVDFPTGQASVLFDKSAVTVKQMTDAIGEAGYRVTGFSQRLQAD